MSDDLAERRNRKEHNRMMVDRIQGMPATSAMRSLVIGDVSYPVGEAAAQVLLAADLAYPCGGEHDLHLSPDGPRNEGWGLADIERLLAALLPGPAAGAPCTSSGGKP